MANISNFRGVSPTSHIAGGTVAINRAVTLDSTENQVVATSAITQVVTGMSLQSAASGELVPIQTHGEAKAVLGTGGATLGAQLMPEASGSGKLVVAAGATAVSCAIALEAGSADETIRVRLTGPNLKGPANS